MGLLAENLRGDYARIVDVPFLGHPLIVSLVLSLIVSFVFCPHTLSKRQAALAGFLAL